MKTFLCALIFAIVSIVSFAYEPPNERRIGRAKLISSFIKPGDIGAEIGVSSGIFSYHVLLKKDPAKLYLIDPWDYWPKRRTEMEEIERKKEEMDRRYEQVCSCFAPYENVEVIRLRSEEAVGQFPDEYFDYVYIDAEHSYQAVTCDLTNYFPKVKVGGYIMGDDYGWTGIKPAVQNFLHRYKDECIFVKAEEGQFILQKIK